MNVWLLCDDYYHSADIVVPGLAPLKEKGIQFTITKDTTNVPIEQLSNYDTLILAKGNDNTPQLRESWLTAKVQRALINYVESGGGLLVLHSGITGLSEETKQLYDMIGSSFDYHPKQCSVTISPTDETHPIMRQIPSFTVKDEHYHIKQIAKDIHVLFETVSEHGRQIGGYVRTQKNGRVCVLTPGHNLENWLESDYQRLLYQALLWCGKSFCL